MRKYYLEFSLFGYRCYIYVEFTHNSKNYVSV